MTDAEVIRRHYLARYGADSTAIAYGVDPADRGVPDPTLRGEGGGSVLARLGLAERRYFLYVSRFEPENNPAPGGGGLPGGGRRAAAGDGGRAPPTPTASSPGFTAGADPRILFPGPIYGAGYRELLAHALAYVHATEVGGTHPALVEAMGFGNCVLVNDTPENREVAGDAALYFRAAEPAGLAADARAGARRPRRGRGGSAAPRRRGRPASTPGKGSPTRYAELFDRLAGGIAA